VTFSDFSRPGNLDVSVCCFSFQLGKKFGDEKTTGNETISKE